MDTAHLESGYPLGVQDGSEERFLALAAWLGRQQEELSPVLSALRQADALHWVSAAGNAFRATLEEQRCDLLRAVDSLEEARTAAALHAAWLASERRRRALEAQRQPGSPVPGLAGFAVHYEGR